MTVHTEAPGKADTMAPLLSAQEYYELEQFYFTEAAYLDESRFDEWLELFTDDATYWVPVRQTRLTGQLQEEFTKPGEIALLDDDRETLGLRVRKLQSAYAWGENPPSRTRHLYSNIRVTAREEDLVTVSLNFIFYRGYLADDADWWVGRRVDHLRPDGGSYKIARREVFLDHTVVTAKNLSHFF